MKQRLAFEFKVTKADSEKDIGYIEGYASTFGNVDLGYDVVDRGAFSKTINDKKGKFPILLDHDPCKQIGWNIEAHEDDKGLMVKGEIQLITEEAKNRYALAKRAVDLGTKMGLSIGYSTIKSEPDFEKPLIRHLKELKLWEYSFVTFPMNQEASITQAKAAEWAGLFDRMQKGGYTVTQIENALEALGIKKAHPPAATQEIDPAILQSMDRLIQTIKA